jgi:hypothetical protein
MERTAGTVGARCSSAACCPCPPLRILERMFGLMWSLIFFDYELTRTLLTSRPATDTGVLVVFGLGLVTNLLKFYALKEMYLATLKLW